MSVRKIFIVLITIVVCVILGAFVLNVLMPNVVSAVVNAVEGTIYNATGMSMDFNGDGDGGDQHNTYDYDNAVDSGDEGGFAEGGAGVTGYN